MKKAIILLSGGLDSTTCLAIAKDKGYECYALSFSYGQRHEDVELKASKKVASAIGVREHLVANFDLRGIGGSALTSDDHEVPKDRKDNEIGGGVPITYVPARNTIFLSFALAWAEVINSTDIFIGVNALDYSGYPDCRPEFISAFEALANQATVLGTEKNKNIKIHSPLANLDKAGIVKNGIELGVDYSLTHTCYDPEGMLACGRCDACQLRLKGFSQAGYDDPITYVKR